MEKDDLLPEILNNQMSMSNIAARGAQGFTLREKRLFVAGVSKINPHHLAKPLTFKERTLQVTAKEYAEIAGIEDYREAYKDIKAASENLFNRYLRQVIETPKGKRERKFRWISGVEYKEDEGYVLFSLTEEIMPHISQLMGKFTSYRLRQTTELRSVYSWRFLELFTSYLGKDETKPFSKIIELEDLRHTFEIPTSYKWNDIKRRVIEPAIKELTAKDNWLIEWQPIKLGRSVVKIKFTFSKNKQSDMFSD
jgi:plasmid replication initiation protein